MIIEELKKEQLKARKNRDTHRATVLTTLMGDALKIGKDDGNRLTTDDECTKLIKKFIKNAKQTIEVSDRDNSELELEIIILEEFIPNNMSVDDLENQIKIIINSLGDNANIGMVMKQLKKDVDNFDGRVAMTIVKDCL